MESSWSSVSGRTVTGHRGLGVPRASQKTELESLRWCIVHTEKWEKTGRPDRMKTSDENLHLKVKMKTGPVEEKSNSQFLPHSYSKIHTSRMVL